jgi:hypothetical protein
MTQSSQTIRTMISTTTATVSKPRRASSFTALPSDANAHAPNETAGS